MEPRREPWSGRQQEGYRTPGTAPANLAQDLWAAATGRKPIGSTFLLLRLSLFTFGLWAMVLLSKGAQRGAWDSAAVARHHAVKHGMEVVTLSATLAQVRPQRSSSPGAGVLGEVACGS